MDDEYYIREIETLEFKPELLEQRKILVRWEPFIISKKDFRWKTKGGYAQSKDKTGTYNNYPATIIDEFDTPYTYKIRYDNTEEDLDTLRKQYKTEELTRLYNTNLRKYLTNNTDIGKLDHGNTFVKNEVSFRSPENMTDEQYTNLLSKITDSILSEQDTFTPLYFFKFEGDNMKSDVGNLDKFLDNKNTGSLQRYKEFYGTSHNNNAPVLQHPQSSKRLIDHCTGVSGITGPQNCKQLIGSLIHFLIEWEVYRFFNDEKEVNMWSVVFSGKHKGRESTAYEVDDSDIAWAYHFVGQYWSEKNDTTPTLDTMMVAASRIQHIVEIIYAAYNLYISNFRGPITQDNDERGTRTLGPSVVVETAHQNAKLEKNSENLENTSNSNGLSIDLLFGYTGDEAQMSHDSTTSVEALHTLHSACAIEIKTTTHRPWQETKEHWAELRSIYRKAIKPYRQHGFQGVVFVIIIVYPFAEVIVFQWVNYKLSYITNGDVPRLQLLSQSKQTMSNTSNEYITRLYNTQIKGKELYPEYKINTLENNIETLNNNIDTLKTVHAHNINTLRTEKQQLHTANQTLDTENQKLDTKISIIQSQNNTLANERDALDEKNQGLKHMIQQQQQLINEQSTKTLEDHADPSISQQPKKRRISQKFDPRWSKLNELTPQERHDLTKRQIDPRWVRLKELTLQKLHDLTELQKKAVPGSVWMWGSSERQSIGKATQTKLFKEFINRVFEIYSTQQYDKLNNKDSLWFWNFTNEIKRAILERTNNQTKSLAKKRVFEPLLEYISFLIPLIVFRKNLK